MPEEAVVPAGADAVQCHETSVVTWDVPSAIVAGERFRITVGLKCASECPLARGRVGVYDHAGARLAVGTLPGDLWPGTTGVYATEVELTAPAEEGLYTWSIKGPEGEPAAPHGESAATFVVRVVSRPDHLVTVETLDAERRVPLAGARVVMHPYQAMTDPRGVAQLRVAKGTYRLFVSETGYMTFGMAVEVSGDLTTKAELVLEPVLERN
jgi:hypothetical protein